MSTDQLKTAATALGPLLKEVVFLGGASIHLWLSDPAAPATVGLNMSAGDLGRDTIRAEIAQLLAAFDGGEPRTSEQEITTEVKRAVDDLKDRGSRPSLIIIPSGWTLSRPWGYAAGRSLRILIR